MKNIIVPTDYSENATNAMHYAAALAKAAKARLVLYHAFAYPVITTDVPYEVEGYIDELEESEMATLQEIKRTLESQYPIEIACISQAGAVSYHLQEIMEREKGDLVVMGLRGSNPALNVLMGGTTFEVMRQGKFPLLIVPGTVTFKRPAHILFACDNPMIENPVTLRPLKEIASLFGAEIEIYTVEESFIMPGEVQKPRASNLEEHLRSLKHVYTFERGEGVRKHILEAIGKNDASILAMIPRHRSLWDYLLGKSDTFSVAMKTAVPMLVLAEKIESANHEL